VAVTGLAGNPATAAAHPRPRPRRALIVGTCAARSERHPLFFALWSAVGIAHIVGPLRLTKASMNDVPSRWSLCPPDRPPRLRHRRNLRHRLAFLTCPGNLPRTSSSRRSSADLRGSRSCPATIAPAPPLRVSPTWEQAALDANPRSELNPPRLHPRQPASIVQLRSGRPRKRGLARILASAAILRPARFPTSATS